METKIDVQHLRLEIVETDRVILHEESDPHRVSRLQDLISGASILRNPPVVVAAGDQSYVVLDGATRTTAFKNQGIPHIAVQVVEYATKAVELGSWFHVVPEAVLGLVVDFVKTHSFGVKEVSVSEARLRLQSRECCLGVTTSNNTALVLNCPPESTKEMISSTMRRTVQLYGGAGEIHRIVNEDLLEVVSKNEAGSGVVLFPTFSPEDIVQFATAGTLLPAGITRHLITGRALNVNVPLEVLKSEMNLSDKKSWLHSWITEKVMNKKARFYHESVFVFDD